MEKEGCVFMEILTIAREWKEKQPLIVCKELTDKEMEYLSYASSCREFLEQFLRNTELQFELFKWVIRDGINPQLFIEHPELQKKLVECHLNGRIGRQGEKMLKVYPDKVTLPFEGVEYNILDSKQVVTFRGNYRLTIEQVFEIFKNKGLRVGNLELMADGIINWNVHRLGWWDATVRDYRVIDVEHAGWWKFLPRLEEITLAEAKERYGRHLDGSIWNVAATASRGRASLDFEKTHAYIELAVPVGGGKYAIYDFGKFAYEFPENVAETLTFFCRTVPATVAYPDENIYYTHRQHAQYCFGISAEQGFDLMDEIAEDIRNARLGNFVYQIESENCAKWSHEKIEAVVGTHKMPNLFKIHLLNTEPAGPCRTIFSLIKKLPPKWQTPILSHLHLPLGAATAQPVIENGKLVEKSLRNHPFWDTGVVYLPSFLLHQKMQGEIIPSVTQEAPVELPQTEI